MELGTNFIHPTKDILGSLSTKLHGKLICLCLTGSVAIINSVHVARGLMRHGAEVVTVMTKEACDLIQPELMQWATGNPVITNISGNIEHVFYAGERESKKGRADMILICPATANTIGKIAHGVADTPVTEIATVALGSKVPFTIVPAMHDSMYRNPIVQENLQILHNQNVHILGPRLEENKAKIATPEEIIAYVVQYFSVPQDLLGKSFLITAGPTREWIDHVRFISNPSTGKMGTALANEIHKRGGKVVLVLGPTVIHPDVGITVIDVETAQDFLQNTLTELSHHNYDMLIATAAVADFKPKQIFDGKISSDTGTLQLTLTSTPKLITEARKKFPNLYIIAFKAEPIADPANLIEKGFARLQSSGANLIVANNIHPESKSTGFGSDTNEVYVIDHQKTVTHLGIDTKIHIATELINCILKKYIKN